MPSRLTLISFLHLQCADPISIKKKPLLSWQWVVLRARVYWGKKQCGSDRYPEGSNLDESIEKDESSVVLFTIDIIFPFPVIQNGNYKMLNQKEKFDLIFWKVHTSNRRGILWCFIQLTKKKPFHSITGKIIYRPQNIRKYDAEIDVKNHWIGRS